MGNEYRMYIQVDWMETPFQRSATGATDDDILTLYVTTTHDQNKMTVGPVAIGKFVSGSSGDLRSPIRTPEFTVTDSDSVSIWCTIDNKASTGVEKAVVDGVRVAGVVIGALAGGELLVAEIGKYSKTMHGFLEQDAQLGGAVAALLELADTVLGPVLEGLGLTDPDCDGPVFRPRDLLLASVGDLAKKWSRSDLARLPLGIPTPIGLWTDTSQTSPSACGHSPEATIRVSGAFTWQKNPTIVPKSKVAALSTRPNGASLFALATDGYVWSKFFPDPQKPSDWSGWFRLGDKRFLAPEGPALAALSTGPGASTLFMLDDHGQVWSNFFPASSSSHSWSDWFGLGPTSPTSTYGLTAVSTNPGGSSLYIIKDGRLQTNFFPSERGGWSNWFTIASNIHPTIDRLVGVSAQPNGTSLFALDGSRHQVWSRTFPDVAGGSTWSEWRSLGRLPNSQEQFLALTAVSTNVGSVSVYAVAGDGQLWSKFSQGADGNWSDWFSLGGTFAYETAGVAALSTQPGGTSLFGVFADGKVWTKFFPDSKKNGLWSDWMPLFSATNPDLSFSAISALSTHPGGTSLFAVDQDGILWSRYFPDANGNWSDWFPL